MRPLKYLDISFEYTLKGEGLEKEKEKDKQKMMDSEFNYLGLLFLSSQDEYFIFDQFDSSYLDFLRNLSFDLPQLTQKKEGRRLEFVWGHHDELTKQLASKLAFAHILKQLDLEIPQTFFLKKKKELPSLDFSKKWVLKRPYSFSGKGFYFPKNQRELAKIVNQEESELLLQPWLEKKQDYSLLVTEQGSIQLKMRTGTQGRFQFIEMAQDCPSDLLRKQEKLLDFLQKHKAKRPYTIDSFVTEQGDCLISEINYRRSFGQLFTILKQKMGATGLGLSFKENLPEGQHLVLSPMKKSHKLFVTLEE